MILRVTEAAPANLSFPYTDALEPGDEIEVDDAKGAALLDAHDYLEPADPGDAAEITLDEDEYEVVDDESNGDGGGLGELTKSELYDRASEADIDGRSSMDKGELIAALREHEG
jgi:hypothetical protein